MDFLKCLNNQNKYNLNSVLAPQKHFNSQISKTCLLAFLRLRNNDQGFKEQKNVKPLLKQ